ncbi:hypothetical protein R5R35_008277 [Gryllus longicercus]|uniref:Uncharacterized protein n=1 Tax=Gryllus longicercus TaxID=2509291 RepID=A0AAN9YXJ5_9ORTH
MLPRVWVGVLLAAALLAAEAGAPPGTNDPSHASEPSAASGAGDASDAARQPHSRQKRVLWVTNDGRLALPPGTSLVITPTLSLPFVRYPPHGFLSNMTISLPFTIDFDKLGLTDNENPYGVLPPILARSMGRMSASLLADYVAKVMERRRLRRASDPPPTPPPNANFHGGERALLYSVVEDFLANFGMDGRACLLRAICEVHGHPLHEFGFLGEIIKLFFTASKSPFADLLTEYVTAEQAGKDHGECWPYYKDCPKSLFRSTQKHKYMEDTSAHDEEENEVYDDIHSDEERTSKVTLEKSEVSSKAM